MTLALLSAFASALQSSLLACLTAEASSEGSREALSSSTSGLQLWLPGSLCTYSPSAICPVCVQSVQLVQKAKRKKASKDRAQRLARPADLLVGHLRDPQACPPSSLAAVYCSQVRLQAGKKAKQKSTLKTHLKDCSCSFKGSAFPSTPEVTPGCSKLQKACARGSACPKSMAVHSSGLVPQPVVS